MVFGVLKDQKAGKAVITCMKYLSTILAHCKLKIAAQMIHMLEGMVPQLANNSLKIAKVF